MPLVGAAVVVVLLVLFLRWGRRKGRLRWAAPVALLATGLVLVGGWVLRGQPVELASVPAIDERSLQVRYLTGECATQTGVDIEERAAAVVVTVRERTTARSCSDVGVEGVARVELDRPLGGRDVVDGSNGRRLQVD